MEGDEEEEEEQRDGKSWFVEHMLTKAKTSMKQYHGGLYVNISQFRDLMAPVVYKQL